MKKVFSVLFLFVLLLPGCRRDPQWSDPARNMVDVDVTPDGKWVK